MNIDILSELGLARLITNCEDDFALGAELVLDHLDMRGRRLGELERGPRVRLERSVL